MAEKTNMYYIFHGRFPSEKAAAIYTHKNVESFVNEGIGVTVIVPRRIGREPKKAVPYRVLYLPTIDLFFLPIQKAAFLISYTVFSIMTAVYILICVPRDSLIVSNEALPLILIVRFFRKTMYEIHDFPERNFWMYRYLFRRVRWILVTNAWKKRELAERFFVDGEKSFIEPNGVDLSFFNININKNNARKRLGLPEDGRIAVYTGHLYGWKGVDTLARAAGYLSEVDVYFIGGTKSDVLRFKRKYGHQNNIYIVGHKSHGEIPLWQKAADILILPNTAKKDISKYYTSPMKLFEYMASGTPIVASDIPSIREIVDDASATFFTPDDPADLKEKIQATLADTKCAQEKAVNAYKTAREHDWNARAKRIISHITV